MGIKLDWEIESEQTAVRGTGEDRSVRRRRRIAQVRLLFVVLLVIGFFAALYGLVWWRLGKIDAELRRALVDTVGAEVATLRISDRQAYLDIQRSASDVWLQLQQATFDEYQQLKTNYDVQLTGNVVSVEVSGTRGRVQVEEIINGVPYVQTWFYWRYAEDGWRHVPPDYTFWGETVTLERTGVIVRYQDVDTDFAGALATSLESWLSFTCTSLDCTGLPLLEVEIIPRPGLAASWSEIAPWTLHVPSPYVGRARLDRPFDTPLQQALAALMAERLVARVTGSVQPVPYTDAAYLTQAVKHWLAGQFTQVDTQSYLVQTYAERYGSAAVGRTLQSLTPDAPLSILNAPAGVAGLDTLEVDWRDYLTWRLNTEAELHAAQNQAGFVAMYDTREQAVADLAFSRFAQPVSTVPREVMAVQPERQPDSTLILKATVRVGEAENVSQETARFRLADGVWRRIN